jgi:hypothetical protein
MDEGPLVACKCQTPNLSGPTRLQYSDTLFNSLASWWLQDRDVQRAAAEEQRARYVGDPWDPIISEYVSTRSVASVSEILKDVLKLSPEHWTQNEQNRVARCLKALDFERFQKRAGKDKPWHYRRKKPVS